MSRIFSILIFALLAQKSRAVQNVFSDEAEDFLDNADDSTVEDEWFQKEHRYQKSGKQNYEADVEVILNPGPMIAPDIIIRQFVDPKMSIDKMMEEMLASKKKYSSFIGEDDDSQVELDILQDHPSTAENEIDDKDRFTETTTDVQQSFVPEQTPQKTSSSDLKTFIGNQPCRMKFNGSSGHFSLNFTQDCLVLITTPEKKSTVVLTCSPVVIGNCSTSRDVFTVNFKGDMRFGRNSYIYCGANAQVRATSLRRRISIKIRKSDEDRDQISECSFYTRKRRELFLPRQGNEPYTNVGLPATASCGRLGRASKIVGGRRVTPGLFPWVAQLDISRTDGTQTACTGSLVSPHYVLTAAHCLKNAESISVFLGGVDRHEFTGSEIIVQAEKYILHRKWSPKTLTADIALVKLTDAVKYSEDVSPICLPRGKLRHETFDGRKGVAVGWGRVESRKKAPRQLYRVRLPFLDDSSCQRHYRRFFVPNLMVCTDSSEEAAICYGDSGGPLMYKRSERVYQIGVASFSLSKHCGLSPDVFSLVSPYLPFIDRRIIEEANGE